MFSLSPTGEIMDWEGLSWPWPVPPWEKGKAILDSSWSLAPKLWKTVSGFSDLNVKCLLEFPQIFFLKDHFVPRPFTDNPQVNSRGSKWCFRFPILPVMEIKKTEDSQVGRINYLSWLWSLRWLRNDCLRVTRSSENLPCRQYLNSYFLLDIWGVNLWVIYVIHKCMYILHVYYICNIYKICSSNILLYNFHM